MTLTEIIATVGGGGVVIFILSIIKIKPLEISFWHWLARKIGQAFNGETLDRVREVKEDVQSVKKTLDEHLEEEKEKDILGCRQRILQFADEMYMNKYHSKEHFEEILEQIKVYNDYCSTHPDFKNDRTGIAQKLIKDQYEECMRRKSFDLHSYKTK